MSVSPATAVASFKTAMTGLRTLHETKSVSADNLPALTETATAFTTGLQGLTDLATTNPSAVPPKAITAITTDLTNINNLKNSAAASINLGTTFQIDAANDKNLGTANSDAQRAVDLLSKF